MFTLRFMDGADSTVVCGNRYDVRHLLTEDQVRAEAAIVTIYPQMTSDVGGTEFHVGGERGHGVCFAENQAGKTIDKIGAFEAPVSARRIEECV